MTPLALQHGVVICWRFHWIMVNCIKDCTWPAIVHSTQDWMALRISVCPRKPSVHHWQQQFGLLTQRRSMETILRTQQKCWFIRHVYLFPVFTCPFLVSVGPPETQIVVFGRCTWEPKSYFPFQSCFMCWVLPCKECPSLWPSFLKLFSSNLSSSEQPCLLYNFCFSSFLLLSRKSHQLFQKYTNQSKSATKCKQLTSHLPLFF